MFEAASRTAASVLANVSLFERLASTETRTADIWAEAVAPRRTAKAATRNRALIFMAIKEKWEGPVYQTLPVTRSESA